MPSKPPVDPQLTPESATTAVTVGQAKNLWSEVMFYLALFFVRIPAESSTQSIF